MNFTKDESGKLIFVGKEDPNNPPTSQGERSKMTCPICKEEVDYLLGDVRQGCEACYDKSKDKVVRGGETYDHDKEVL